MAPSPDIHDKVARPHASYTAPDEVVLDPDLTRRQNEKALENLEQDARQLAETAAEGMAGGRQVGLGPATDLRAVLDARDALNLSPVETACKVVLKDLHDRSAAAAGGPPRALLEQAGVALEGLQSPATAAAAAAAAAQSADPPYPRSPQFQVEVREELAKERLDP